MSRARPLAFATWSDIGLNYEEKSANEHLLLSAVKGSVVLPGCFMSSYIHQGFSPSIKDHYYMECHRYTPSTLGTRPSCVPLRV